ncbi:cell cycle inhibitor Nif1, putative [Talaromyces stipitatus ATCC 10500]|uniref:Cell cycle inhibitor Nif1, putative n=1 Tax=Talaromyces stipitatus (strain ATCC 10500 / CBS 375.48 / QM 6759 / NRRL 1006) TaxID=441959 RepID=B8MHA3_TALSN|nr:cell cycle inhibitor Nif1, putative [Talaromyces stipitatus ATCC 10500]EED17082.1 cell cycle inhibitor Nif1, putative [Talaromyces stipitatus ATCC 10500]
MPHIRTPSNSRESSYDSIPPPQVSTTLAPASPIPPSLYYSPQPESSDDDYTSSNGGSTWSKSRKLSTGSGISMPHSPMSPFVRSHPRSPSVSSEASNYLPRPSFNFSRPLSRSSTSMSLSAPSPVMPSETPSQPNSNISTPVLATHSTNGIRRENKPAPIVLGAEPMSAVGEEPPSSAVESYVYAKYSLPRGRMVSRNSLVFAGLQTPHFEWKEPLFQSSPPQERRTPSPEAHFKEAPTNATFNTRPPDTPLEVPTRVDPLDTVPTTVRQSHEIVRETGQHPVLQRSYSERLDDATSVSTESNSTIRPPTSKTTATSPAMEQTAEEHVEKGIECHEKGALQESTYHLRIAAKQNHPTGMLLYALACRHGWGMRPNQREGVQWLRKAVDSAGLDIGEDDEAPAGGRDAAARKARRAQFALGIYELGVSHLNGWGIEQDKVLALRCFEIAAQWGDADALAEAGFCYAEGIGCKKNLKKAAHYYRLAEAKGMSMVGNSWIYKDKYMSDDEDSKRSRQPRRRDTGASDKNPRSKSRTRSIFARKK